MLRGGRGPTTNSLMDDACSQNRDLQSCSRRFEIRLPPQPPSDSIVGCRRGRCFGWGCGTIVPASGGLPLHHSGPGLSYGVPLHYCAVVPCRCRALAGCRRRINCGSRHVVVAYNGAVIPCRRGLRPRSGSYYWSSRSRAKAGEHIILLIEAAVLLPRIYTNRRP
jgi:hypothetical protein